MARRKKARLRFDHVFIISRHPETGKEANLGDLNKYVLHVDFHLVDKEVKKWEKLLYSVSNQYINPLVHGNKNLLRVHGYIFQHGEHVADQWQDFEEYVAGEVKTKMKERHRYLAREFPEWYAKHSDLQVYDARWWEMIGAYFSS